MAKGEGQGKSPSYITPAYAFRLAVIAVCIVSLGFFLIVWIFHDKFTDAGVLTTAISSWLGIVATITGAYFGIKISSDAHDKTRSANEQANRVANKALGALDSKEAKRILGEEYPPRAGS